MTDRLKHELYDIFLKDTPVSFESVTDQQWESMARTINGFAAALRVALEEIGTALANIFKEGKQ